MGKNLSERIANAASEAKLSTRGAKNRANFLALRLDIEKAVEDGWSLKLIWEQLKAEGKLEYSFSTFHRLYSGLLRPNQEGAGIAPAPVVPTKQVATPRPASANPAQTVSNDRPADFTFNPIPNTDDLI